MSDEEISQRIVQIAACAPDFETQHALEDELYHEFIAYIATLKLPMGLSRKATAILNTKKIKFQRVSA